MRPDVNTRPPAPPPPPWVPLPEEPPPPPPPPATTSTSTAVVLALAVNVPEDGKLVTNSDLEALSTPKIPPLLLSTAPIFYSLSFYKF